MKLIMIIFSLLILVTNSQTHAADNDGIMSAAQKKKFSTANPEDITNENFPDLIQSFDYTDADITDVIKAISKLTGKNIIMDPGVRGKITIVAPTEITVAEAWKAFLTALASNGLTVVPAGKFLKIKQAKKAQKDAIETYAGAYYPNTDQMITRIIKLKFISADEVNKRLRILISGDGEMNPYEPTNSIIISDYGSNIQRMSRIIEELDKPGFEEKMDVIPIKNAKAKDISSLVEKIINKDSGGSNSRFRSSRRFSGKEGASSGTKAIPSMVAPDERTNAIIVVGNDAAIKKVKELIRQLDYAIDPADSGGVYVYYVRHGDAKTMSESLNGVAEASKKNNETVTKSSTSSKKTFVPPNKLQKGIFGGDVKIVADENTNSLIVTASKTDYQVVKSLLNKLDIAKDQVYVEAIILEMASNDTTDYGITYYKFLKGEETQGTARVGFSSRTPLQIGNLIRPPGGSPGAILGFGTGETFKLNIPSVGEIAIPSLLSFIEAMTTYTNSNVLSTPQIIALDNEEAEIEVGDEVNVGPSVSTIGNSTSTSSAPSFKEAKIKLKVKPFISPDTDIIRLNVEQQIKKQKGENFSDKSLKTSIVLHDGNTAVLGGLMEDTDIITETKVPLLGDIPLLGWLFKGRNKQKVKSNLLIFLTPKIIRNPIDHKKLLSNKLNQRNTFIKNNTSGKDPHKDLSDQLQMPSTLSGESPNLSFQDEEGYLDIGDEVPITNSKNKKKKANIENIDFDTSIDDVDIAFDDEDMDLDLENTSFDDEEENIFE